MEAGATMQAVAGKDSAAALPSFSEEGTDLSLKFSNPARHL
jgi:hypothetical protein